jgi:energy-coupling factor transporter ATP-binding protein EcfA2
VSVEAFRNSTRFDGLELVGRGAQGEVYRARDLELGVPVALKRIGTLGAEAIVQLKAEFRAAAALSHPNLVQLHELFVDDELAYFSMELVEGVTFLEALRAVAKEEHARLFQQLCDGLGALHDSGLVHRDIKPTNILVRPDGRVVLLDFGFVRDARAFRATPQLAEGLVGTLAYMAPEQLLGAVATSSADVYAAGALLHEALGGSPPDPWLGGPSDASTSVLGDEAPEPLRSLVAAMLRVDPRQRPRIQEVRDVLLGRSAELRSEAVDLPFVGRTKERAVLRDAVLSSEAATAVEVCGPSGVGKTELVRRFIGELEPSDALVLRSRCRPSEIVPYQAFDAAVDELGVELLSRETGSQEKIVEHAARAATLFPSLARLVPPDADVGTGAADPIERRREAVEALRILLGIAADGRRLVLWIDDAQWADEDSTTLLADLVAGDDALTVHWVLTTRSEAAESSPLARALAAAAGNSAIDVRTIALGPLSAEESSELVHAIAASRSMSESAMSAVVDAGAGHPFVLTRLASLGTVSDETVGSFSYVLAHVTDDLLDEEHRLLEIVAIARQPTELDLVLEAAGTGRAGVIAVRKLESRRLVRTSPRRNGVLVDSYHDQVPDTLLATLRGERVRDGHHRLALAHEKRGSDPAVLSHHFHGAGDLPKASVHAEAAGHQANAALAFAKAAKLFESARVWDDAGSRAYGNGPEPRGYGNGAASRVPANGAGSAARISKLLELEGTALANAGSLAGAGQRYLEAASGADGLASLELRRRAVESLLAGGRVEDALRELRALLKTLKLPYPSSDPTAMLRAIASLGSYLLRPASGGDRAVDPVELLRIDTCYSVGRRLADIDPSRGSYFLAASLSRAARGGDPTRLARSLCTAGGALGAVAGRTVNRIGDRLMSDASAISERVGTEELAGMLDVAYGEIHMLGGRWREALDRSRTGVARLETKPGYVFECNVGRIVVLRALEELGRPSDEYEEGRALLDWAVAHHNEYVEMRAVQHLILACLARDRSDEARRHVRTIDRWLQGKFEMQRLYAIRNESLCDLYDGDIDSGVRRLDAMEPQYRRSVLRQVPLIRIDVEWLRGQLALASCAARASDEKLGRALAAAKALEREGRRDASLRAKLLRAGVESFRDVSSATLIAEEAAREASGLGMEGIAAALSARAAEWRRETCDRELSQLRESGVGEPSRYARYLVPGSSRSS